MRRRTFGAVVVAGILAGTGPALASRPPVASGGFADTSTVLASSAVPVSGAYRVAVSLLDDSQAGDVAVYVPGRPARTLHLRLRVTNTTFYTLKLKSSMKRLLVRAVSALAGVQATVTLVAEPGSGSPPPGLPTPLASAGTAFGVGTPAPSSGATGTTGSTTISGTAPPFDPYTRLLLSDQFSGPRGAAPDSDGADLTASVGNGSCGPGTLNTDAASSANASLDGSGDLAITALANGSGSTPYTSAQLESAFSSAYGSVQARIKLPPGQGLCSAFWLVGNPTDGTPSMTSPCTWPACGEIDVDESPSFVGSQFPNYPIDSIFTLHGPISNGSNQQYELPVRNTTAIGDPTAGFHTYGIIWSPGSIVWTLDGVAYATVNQSTVDAYVAANDPGAVPTWEFDQHNFHVILDLAVGGWPGTPPAGAGGEFPATMLVNWVRWYGCQIGTPQNGCT